MSQLTSLDEVTGEELESKVSDLSVPDVSIKTQEMLKEEEKLLKYNNFCINFKDRIEQWTKAHTDKGGNCPKAPIYYDSEYGDWVWLSRETRRQR